jgi:hypothetical protein
MLFKSAALYLLFCKKKLHLNAKPPNQDGIRFWWAVALFWVLTILQNFWELNWPREARATSTARDFFKEKNGHVSSVRHRTV